MIKKIENMTIEDINNIEFLNEEEIQELSFAELCIYQEQLNKIKARYDELKREENN